MYLHVLRAAIRALQHRVLFFCLFIRKSTELVGANNMMIIITKVEVFNISKNTEMFQKYFTIKNPPDVCDG